MNKTLQEKIDTIQKCADNTDGNCVMLSSVYECIRTARVCISRIGNGKFACDVEYDWEKSANSWIEKAAQHLWGFNRPKIW